MPTYLFQDHQKNIPWVFPSSLPSLSRAASASLTWAATDLAYSSLPSVGPACVFAGSGLNHDLLLMELGKDPLLRLGNTNIQNGKTILF